MNVDPMAGIEVTTEALVGSDATRRAARLHLIGFVLQALADDEPIDQIVRTLKLEEPPTGNFIFGTRPTLETLEGQQTILADWLGKQISYLVRGTA